jgi:anti-anti-sigma factor
MSLSSPSTLVSVLPVPQRLNATNIASFVKQMNDLRSRRVVLDLEVTAGIDSTALAAIVQFYRRQMDRGGDVVLARASEGVRRILIVTRLEQLLRTAPSIEAAAALSEAS